MLPGTFGAVPYTDESILSHHMTFENKKYAFVPFLLIAWGVYAAFNLAAPLNLASLEKYNLSASDLYLVRVSFQLPILILWAAVFYGAFRFWRYTRSIAGAPEEAGLRALSAGLFVFLVGLVVPSYVGLWNAYHPGDEGVRTITSLINLYVSIGSSLTAFMFIAVGGKRLAALAVKPFQLTRALLMSVAAVALLGGFYVNALFNNPDRLMATTAGVSQPTYYLPSDAWIIGSVVVPYLLVWCIGFLAALSLWHFATYVSGTIYQKAFRGVARGIAWIVCTSIGLQLLGQFSASFVNTSFSAILAIVFALLGAIAVGYLFIAYGARELARLEAV